MQYGSLSPSYTAISSPWFSRDGPNSSTAMPANTSPPQVELWALSTLIDQINDDGVDHIIATPRAITAEIEAWHRDLPPGLVTLKPMIRPI